MDALAATLADIYVLSLVIGGLEVLVAGLRGRAPSTTAVLSSLVFIVVIPIAYRWMAAEHTLFLSPGDRMTGAYLEEGIKRWRNPFTMGRGALFLTFLMCLMWAGTAFKGIRSRGPWALVLGLRALLVASLVLGLTQAGEGRVFGAIGPAVYFAGMAASLLLAPPDAEKRTFWRGMALSLVAFGAVAVAVIAWYGSHRLPGLS